MATIKFIADDGSEQDFQVTIPGSTGVSETEVAKVETEVAAVDTELKADETSNG